MGNSRTSQRGRAADYEIIVETSITHKEVKTSCFNARFSERRSAETARARSGGGAPAWYSSQYMYAARTRRSVVRRRADLRLDSRESPIPPSGPLLTSVRSKRERYHSLDKRKRIVACDTAIAPLDAHRQRTSHAKRRWYTYKASARDGTHRPY